MTKLPIFTLNPIELALTLPGVQYVSNSQFSNGQSIQVSGARPRANNFLIDGQEINDISIGGQAVQPNIPSMYQDTVVYTHNPPAEYGRASGGVVNLISRAGTNQFHGQAWELYSGSGLNAVVGPNRGTDSGKTRFNQHQYGFTVGGPIWKDKLFAFGGGQWSRLYGKEQPPFITYPNANGIALLKQIAAGTGTTATNAQLLLSYLNNGKQVPGRSMPGFKSWLCVLGKQVPASCSNAAKPRHAMDLSYRLQPARERQLLRPLFT